MTEHLRASASEGETTKDQGYTRLVERGDDYAMTAIYQPDSPENGAIPGHASGTVTIELNDGDVYIGGCVGEVRSDPSSGRGYIYMLSTDIAGKYQGRGLGRKMMEVICDEARRLGLTELRTDVVGREALGIRLSQGGEVYEKHTYIPISKEEAFQSFDRSEELFMKHLRENAKESPDFGLEVRIDISRPTE